jgi:hypothetical protein
MVGKLSFLFFQFQKMRIQHLTQRQSRALRVNDEIDCRKKSSRQGFSFAGYASEYNQKFYH